jgi:hypothetical protein
MDAFHIIRRFLATGGFGLRQAQLNESGKGANHTHNHQRPIISVSHSSSPLETLKLHYVHFAASLPHTPSYDGEPNSEN